MKDLKITLNIINIELIPTLVHPTERSYIFNWLGLTIYFLKSKKRKL